MFCKTRQASGYFSINAIEESFITFKIHQKKCYWDSKRPESEFDNKYENTNEFFKFWKNNDFEHLSFHTIKLTMLRIIRSG